jgi:hypothetical protein
MSLSTAAGPWFHGGVGGLEPGDELLPGGWRVPTPHGVIYVSLNYNTAEMYAHRRGGCLYEVEIEFPTAPPFAEFAAAVLESPDPRWPPPGEATFAVRRAAVLRVVKHFSPRTHHNRQPIHRRKPDATQ